MEKVHEGQIWLDRDSTGRLWGELNSQPEIDRNNPAATLLEQLSGREKKIFSTVLGDGGESTKEMAARLFISESTLRNHLTSTYKKCGFPVDLVYCAKEQAGRTAGGVAH